MGTPELPLVVAWSSADEASMVLDVATRRGHVEVVASIPPPRDGADRWAEVELRAPSRTDAVGFVEDLAAWLDVPLGPRIAGGRTRRVRGRMLLQGYAPGARLTSKLALAEGDRFAEVFLNVRRDRGELAPKDDGYGEPLVSCFALGFGVADGARPRPPPRLDADAILDRMRRGGALEPWAEAATPALLARVREALDEERASPPARHSFLRVNAATLLLRLGEPDASARFAEGVLDARRNVAREHLATLSRITDRVLPSLDPRYAAALDPAVLVPALDAIVARHASSTAVPDVHDKDLAERIRARLLERP